MRLQVRLSVYYQLMQIWVLRPFCFNRSRALDGQVCCHIQTGVMVHWQCLWSPFGRWSHNHPNLDSHFCCVIVVFRCSIKYLRLGGRWVSWNVIVWAPLRHGMDDNKHLLLIVDQVRFFLDNTLWMRSACIFHQHGSDSCFRQPWSVCQVQQVKDGCGCHSGLEIKKGFF